MMRERPLLFSGPMICAILMGIKTKTRRVIKDPQKYTRLQDAALCCRYGQPGDRLWTRERLMLWPGTTATYDADGEPVNNPFCAGYTERQDWLDHYSRTCVPAIHMPRWASRLTLEICEVRVEQVQAITEEEAIAEGIGKTALGYRDYELPANVLHGVPAIYSFQTLWDSLHARTAFSWQNNPHVWILTFRRIMP